MKIFGFCLLHSYKEIEGLVIGGFAILQKRECVHCHHKQIYAGGSYMSNSYWMDLDKFLKVNKQYQ